MSTLDEQRGQSQARGGQRWPEAASRTRGTMLFAAVAGLCVFSFFMSAMQLKDVNTRTSSEQELSKQQHFIVEQTHQSEQMGQCLGLDLDDGMDNLLDKYKQVFLVMPAKTAGTTYKHFAENCMASAGTPAFLDNDNIINHKDELLLAFNDQLEISNVGNFSFVFFEKNYSADKAFYKRYPDHIQPS